MTDLKTIKPGVYFDLSFSDYLDDPSLSASGIKNILVAPETFYERSSMNPECKPKDTEALAYGSADHTRVLEGLETFQNEYAIIPDPDDFPDALKGGAALKEACADLDLKKTGTVAELADRVAEADPDAQIWLHIMRDFEAANYGKATIKKDWADKIERRAQLVEGIPEVAKAITGGFAEVSIFWVDEKTGVPLKARVDYLKTKAQVDLKSFANPNGKPVDTALAHAVANYRYYVQVAVHSEAVTQAKMLMRDGKFTAKKPPSKEWIRAFTSAPVHAFIFLFLEKAGCPCIRLKRFTRTTSGNSKATTLAWDAGQGCFRRGVEIWGDFMNRFGPDKPWIDVPACDDFKDEDYPIYMFND